MQSKQSQQSKPLYNTLHIPTFNIINPITSTINQIDHQKRQIDYFAQFNLVPANNVQQANISAIQIPNINNQRSPPSSTSSNRRIMHLISANNPANLPNNLNCIKTIANPTNANGRKSNEMNSKTRYILPNDSDAANRSESESRRSNSQTSNSKNNLDQLKTNNQKFIDVNFN